LVTDYPLAQLVVGCGFFLILTIEQTVLHFQVGGKAHVVTD
jgi:hypothetical protein